MLIISERALDHFNNHFLHHRRHLDASATASSSSKHWPLLELGTRDTDTLSGPNRGRATKENGGVLDTNSIHFASGL